VEKKRGVKISEEGGGTRTETKVSNISARASTGTDCEFLISCSTRGEYLEEQLLGGRKKGSLGGKRTGDWGEAFSLNGITRL